MATYKPTVDIWALTEDELSNLQPGQWVTTGTGEGAQRGRFWGQRRSSTVVAWSGNAKGRGWDYHKALRAYAKGTTA